MRRIYIAGRISQRAFLQNIRSRIWEAGHEVLSTWIDEGSVAAPLRMAAKKVALRDITQISMADLIILDTTSPLAEDGGGGREFEAGFAFGQFQHKEFWIVGPAKSAFHELADDHFSSWEHCIDVLKRDS